MYIRNPGHMTKMAAMPIYGKNPSKIFFSRTGRPISTKLGMKHQWLKHYNVQVNLIITLSLGSMKTDRVISEPCYNEVIYNRHIAK